MNSTSSSKNYLRAGLLAGLVAAVINVIIYLIMLSIGGYDWALMILVSILVASLLPNLVAALGFYGLGRLSSRPRPLLTIAVIAFVLISILPHLGIGPPPSPALAALPEGFDLVTVPLHIVFGLTAILIMPWLVSRN